MEDNKRLNIVITAGPTQEPIDIVRFITNSSTGTFGYMIAQVAKEKGHNVILVSGPTSVKLPDYIEAVQIRTAGQMYETVKRNFYDCDVLIMAAAVCDFRPKQPLVTGKIKKEEGIPILELERTPDTLERLSRIKENQIMVGFALEVSELEEKAKEKLKKKKLDLVIANKISSSVSPFGEKNVDVIIIDKDEKTNPYSDISKKELAAVIVDKVEALSCKGQKIS